MNAKPKYPPDASDGYNKKGNANDSFMNSLFHNLRNACYAFFSHKTQTVNVSLDKKQDHCRGMYLPPSTAGEEILH